MCLLLILFLSTTLMELLRTILSKHRKWTLSTQLTGERLLFYKHQAMWVGLNNRKINTIKWFILEDFNLWHPNFKFNPQTNCPYMLVFLWSPCFYLTLPHKTHTWTLKRYCTSHVTCRVAKEAGSSRWVLCLAIHLKLEQLTKTNCFLVLRLIDTRVFWASDAPSLITSWSSRTQTIMCFLKSVPSAYLQSLFSGVRGTGWVPDFFSFWQYILWSLKLEK